MQEIKKDEEKKIEFKVTYCTSPSWELMLGFRKYKKHSVYFSLSQFLSYFSKSIILLYDENDKPYRKCYLCLRYEGIRGVVKFQQDIKDTILKKYQPVVELEICDSTIIYTKDLKQKLEYIYNKPFYFIPENDRKSSVFKFNSILDKYFKKYLFIEDTDKEKKMFYSEYIGYTGKSKEDLIIGREIPCFIYQKNIKYPLKKYIYLNKIDIITKKAYKDSTIYEYYFLQENTIEQILSELNILIRTLEVQSITVSCRFFDINNIQFKNEEITVSQMEKSLFNFIQFTVDENMKLITSCNSLKDINEKASSRKQLFWLYTRKMEYEMVNFGIFPPDIYPDSYHFF